MKPLKNVMQFKWITLLVILLLPFLFPQQGQAQTPWPPFFFRMVPTYENGQITYDLLFVKSNLINWPMRDVQINIPLPEGTRFVRADAPASMEVTFDGTEIRFFSAGLPRRFVKDFYFVVEPIDPLVQDTYSAYAWIAWKGEITSSFTTKEYLIDINRNTLEWVKPRDPRLEVKTEIRTKVNRVTYFIYPRAAGARIWDVYISVPIPEGAQVLSVEAPPSFEIGTNEQEIGFTAIELERQFALDPFKIELDTTALAGKPFITEIWATWTNVLNRRTVLTIDPEEVSKSPEIVVGPQPEQRILVDREGDAAFANYDLTSITFQEVLLPDDSGSALKATFRTAGSLGGTDQPLMFTLYLDEDCDSSTGRWAHILGAEVRVQYLHSRERVEFFVHNPDTKKWVNIERIAYRASATNNTLTIWIPNDLLEDDPLFCWVAQGRYLTTQYTSIPPSDWLLDNYDYRFLQYKKLNPVLAIETDPASILEPEIREAVQKTRRPSSLPKPPLVESGDSWHYMPGWQQPPENWASLQFNDRSWFSGPTPIGYNLGTTTTLSGTLATDLALTRLEEFGGEVPLLIKYIDPKTGGIIATPPTGQEQSVFLRRTFTITNPDVVGDLKLIVNYRDGFIAYLNGVEVGRRNMAETELQAPFYEAALRPNRRGSSSWLDLNDHIEQLVPGNNVLAIQVHRYDGSLATSLLIDATLKYR